MCRSVSWIKSTWATVNISENHEGQPSSQGQKSQHRSICDPSHPNWSNHKETWNITINQKIYSHANIRFSKSEFQMHHQIACFTSVASYTRNLKSHKILSRLIFSNFSYSWYAKILVTWKTYSKTYCITKLNVPWTCNIKMIQNRSPNGKSKRHEYILSEPSLGLF